MADTKTSALPSYSAPIGADSTPIVDSANSTLKQMTLAAQHFSYFSQSVSAQGAGFATDTYLVGSSIALPAGSPYVGSTYHCVFDVAKTAAGTATPIITLRIGTAGSTADAAICTFTFTAGTAAVDVGTIEVWATFRTVGSGTSAVLQGRAQIKHNLSITGLVNLVSPTLQVTSAGFNSTTASTIIGLSVNGGLSAAWTVQLVRSELIL